MEQRAPEKGTVGEKGADAAISIFDQRTADDFHLHGQESN